ncbi:MAG TPA: septum site-determining protein MinC [Syntrophomonadaceae bacterium]|nr:septum site-determining protein MinC [Syntrophomonadaceae bacterium]
MIKIKGINGNLVIVFGQGLYKDFEKDLHKRFADNIDLFKGSKILFRGDGLTSLSHQEIAKLQKICLDYGMILNNTMVTVEKASNQDLFVYKNIRSGQKVRSEGSIIVWGDVHESAEIMAARDIIVLGKLDGVAHAGCYGNKDSMVFALTLSPGQIRIADQFSRAPSNYEKHYLPEIAYLEDGNICISEYNPKGKFTRIDIIK